MTTWMLLLAWLVWTRKIIAMKQAPRSQSLLELSSLSMRDPVAGNDDEAVLLDQLFACEWDHAVIIRDHWSEQHFGPVAAAVLDRFSSLRHVTLHISWESDHWLEMSLEQLYVVHRMTNVLVMTSSGAGRVLRAAANVFLKHRRGLGALMAHRVQFAVFARALDAEPLPNELKLTPFDNVFVIAPSQVTRLWTDAHTLMWREGGVRELERVDAPSNQSCSAFPNLKFKMNGRNLQLLIKEWLSLAYKWRDQEKGHLKYVGFLTNVVQLLSKSLNFTYDLLPSAEEEESLRWDDFSAFVSQSKFDMGVGIYPSSSIVHFNHTVTFPLICTNFTGCYVHTKPDFARSPLLLYQRSIYICFIGTLVYTLILLKILLLAAPKRNSAGAFSEHEQMGCKNENEHEAKSRSLKSERRVDFQCQVNDADIISNIKPRNFEAAFDEVNRKLSEACASDPNLSQSNTNQFQSDIALNDPYEENLINAKESGLELKSVGCEKKSPSKPFLQIYDSVVNLFFEFIGCSLGQSSLPNPAYFSARLLVWSWCFMVLVLNALFTGNITADLVYSGSEVPLNTLEDLLARGDFKIFIEQDSSFKNAMKSFPQGTIVHSLYIRSEQFQAENPNFNGTLDEMVSKLEQQNVVALLSSPMQEHIREKRIPHLMTLRNAIFESCSGFILPQNSELEMWISDKLRIMTDAGLIEKLKSISRNATIAQYTKEQEVSSLTFNYMIVLFTYCFYGLLSSAIALIIEYACTRFQCIDI